jgi:hypothetical protein
MSLIHITADQRNYLKIIYDIYGAKPFQWNDIKDKIPRRVFTVCCNNKYIHKDGKCQYMRQLPNSGKMKTSYVNSWRLDTTFAERWVQQGHWVKP